MNVKNTSKKLITMILISIIAFTLVACGSKVTIAGSWALAQNGSTEEYVFNQDGTGTHTLSGIDSINIEYKISGETLTITETILGKKTDTQYTYKLESKKLTITKDGQSAVFDKK